MPEPRTKTKAPPMSQPLEKIARILGRNDLSPEQVAQIEPLLNPSKKAEARGWKSEEELTALDTTNAFGRAGTSAARERWRGRQKAARERQSVTLTDSPTTDSPTTDSPTTDSPTTDSPSTNFPTTDSPKDETPVSPEPSSVGSGGFSRLVKWTRPTAPSPSTARWSRLRLFGRRGV